MVQLLPKWMWERSALEFGVPAQLMSIFPGIANEQWVATGLSARQRRRIDEAPVLKMPVVTLEAESLETWATVVAAAGNYSDSRFCVQPKRSEAVSGECEGNDSSSGDSFR